MNEISCTRVKLEKKNYLRTNLAEKNSFAQTESRFFKVMSQSLPAVEQREAARALIAILKKSSSLLDVSVKNSCIWSLAEVQAR